MLLRRYTIEIWLLHPMVKLTLPIAGETGDADNLDGSMVRGLGCDARRASHLSHFVDVPGCPGQGHGRPTSP
jgi:hypothetical protein